MPKYVVQKRDENGYQPLADPSMRAMSQGRWYCPIFDGEGDADDYAREVSTEKGGGDQYVFLIQEQGFKRVSIWKKGEKIWPLTDEQIKRIVRSKVNPNDSPRRFIRRRKEKDYK